MTDTTKIHTSIPAPPSSESTDQQKKVAEQSVAQSDKARFKAKVQDEKKQRQQKLSDSERKTESEHAHTSKNTHSLFKEASAKRSNAQQQQQPSIKKEQQQQPSIKKEQRQGQWTAESLKTQRGAPLSSSSFASAKQQQMQAGQTAQTGQPLPSGAHATSQPKNLGKEEFGQELQALKNKDSTKDKAEAVLQNLQSPTLQHASMGETSATQETAPPLAADTKQMFEEIQSISQHIMRTEQSLREGGSLRIQLKSAVLPQTAVTFSIGASGVLHATFSSNRKESLDKIREHKDALKTHVRSRSGVSIEVDTSDSETSERGSYP